MRVAIATSKEELPPGDEALRQALGRLGVTAAPAIWSDAAIDWTAFDGVLVRSCWDYHLRVDEFLGWIGRLERQGIAVVNAPELIRWNADKRYLRELSCRGLRIPDTAWIEEGRDAAVEQVCRERGWRSTVVKPLVSASAHGTRRLSEGRVSGPAMIQEYCEAIESQGEWSLLYFGGDYSHAVRKLPRGGDFRVQMEYGGTAEPGKPPVGVREFATAALACLPYAAAWARVDIVEGATGPLLMELEVIEPELFLDAGRDSVERVARVALEAIKKGGR